MKQDLSSFSDALWIMRFSTLAVRRNRNYPPPCAVWALEYCFLLSFLVGLLLAFGSFLSCGLIITQLKTFKGTVSRSLEFPLCAAFSSLAFYPVNSTYLGSQDSPPHLRESDCWPPLHPHATAWKTSPGCKLEQLYGSPGLFSTSHGPLPFIAYVRCLEGCCFINFVNFF